MSNSIVIFESDLRYIFSGEDGYCKRKKICKILIEEFGHFMGIMTFKKLEKNQYLLNSFIPREFWYPDYKIDIWGCSDIDQGLWVSPGNCEEPGLDMYSNNAIRNMSGQEFHKLEKRYNYTMWN
jgi:hypothetical protein